MKFELVRNLKGTEILAKTIYDVNGELLLPSGTKLSVGYVNKLKQKFIHSVYIESDELDDVKEDKKISSFKRQALENMPEIFKKLSKFDRNGIAVVEYLVSGLIDHIIKEGDVNTNLYELKQYDDYTCIHCIDTCIMSVFLGIELGLGKRDLNLLAQAALLHDVGKSWIPDEILNKRDKLNREEFEIVKKHTEYGYKIARESGFAEKEILRGILEHHERVDGSGYPFGLRDDNISIFAKIIAICDVFTAVSANRSYRTGFTPNEAYEYVLAGRGCMFDEFIVQKFRDTFSIYPLGCLIKLSNGIEGYVVKQNKGYPDRPKIRILYDNNTREKIIPYEVNLLEHHNLTIRSVMK